VLGNYHITFRHYWLHNNSLLRLFLICDQTLGKIGMVVSDNNNMDVRVFIDNHAWNYSPANVTLVHTGHEESVSEETLKESPEESSDEGSSDSDDSDSFSSLTSGGCLQYLLLLKV